ncbi:T9SS type A sorting domain-containing protein [Corallibacter sp.]|uniref:T9SS type A sorting domain-containing protein n=1 Tax=Corallibacter sp. TaxID=2038084 RepID=UPI003A8FA041
MKNLLNYSFLICLCLILSGFSTKNDHFSKKMTNALPISLTGFNYVYQNGPSLNQTFVLLDENALAREYTLITSSNFEVSLNPLSGFTDELTIDATIISAGSVTIYVRLAAGLSIGFYSDVMTILAPAHGGYPSVLESISLSGECVRKSTEWNGSTWSDGLPDLNSIITIAEDYDTALNGSINAWELNVNSGKTCTVSDNTFISVQKNINISGNLTVTSKGAVVQIDNSATFAVGEGGTSVVIKETSQLTNWYDYTYWSSPVNGITAAEAFPTTQQSRRYWYDAANFLDVLEESENGNSYVAGHDDIDDDGNDWAVLNDSDVLTPGAGYAITSKSSGFTAGDTYNCQFEGPFNTGIINTPIHYNGDNGDNDWNFIGNPYPSAIDADAFFAENASVIGGAIYLWSHASPPASDNNGNQVLNFNTDDYAIINAGSGEIAGGKPVIPNRTIPSGQGFFVQGLSSGNVVFNNNMRIADNTSNSQFFRNQNDNKLWVNLTSDNGVFNQALIAYVTGATSADDGPSYDTTRNLSSDVAAIIYTTIENDTDRKYAIQGKSPSSINQNESISIGFYSAIEEATLYTLSIAQFQGEFFNDNAIYLRDNLLNVTHDIKNTDYTFTSATGEFNNRFEIVFNNNTLSTSHVSALENSLSIIQQNDQEITFKTNNSHALSAVQIYSINGSLVYNLKANNTTETYKLPNLQYGTYVAKVTLNNGAVISKKILTN